MRRPKLSRLAKRLRYALLQNPAITPLPVCPRCGMTTKVEDWSARDNSCKGCELDRQMAWDDSENDRPFLPEEEI